MTIITIIKKITKPSNKLNIKIHDHERGTSIFIDAEI
jgi:hypothetical protein